MAAKSSRNNSPSTGTHSMAFYVAIIAVAISLAGITTGGVAIASLNDPNLGGMLGISANNDPNTVTAYGVIMIVQSAFGLIAGILGLKATRSGYPPDGKIFFIFSIIALLLSIGGLVSAGSASLVSIVIDAMCAYYGWRIMHRPVKKSKKKRRS